MKNLFFMVLANGAITSTRPPASGHGSASSRTARTELQKFSTCTVENAKSVSSQ